jgi:hypothetical protein
MKLIPESIRVNDIELANEIIWKMNETAIRHTEQQANTQAIFAEYERINLAQAEQIAALKKENRKMTDALVLIDRHYVGAYTITEIRRIAKDALYVVPTGDPLPADK